MVTHNKRELIYNPNYKLIGTKPLGGSLLSLLCL